ncbi:TRAP transporter substrate-binding protein [Pusillimonas noertemannii]|uniref:C4-dicarboxylate-binding protein DctP n=1 Tax=Pusillimonas noertemannii TaxID=305977 RepID=A0A2U1CKM1_9BURK|nr:TRAP transporter substrate-binding protein [Pusillimonas noertemannii]NYT69076.1 TRAP transporter substrate-binding protein [Pusillimonas noertemannii]PVY61543.1 C4-dicarboxylate-binding protein DctP [Pusillimonas noertemannii]TFL09492.1 TRAP transporter substrate-binding protein [Pusillimonas noertemannii]
MKTSHRIKQTLYIAGLTVAALGMAAGPLITQARSLTMKIAHVAPQGDPRDTAARHVADTMNNSATCKVEAKVYPAGQLGSTTDLVEGMQLGSLEAVIIPGSYLVGFEPIMGLMDFPYFWPNDLNKMLSLHQSDAVRKMLDTTDSQGVYSMAIWHTGYKQWTANGPLVQPSDYKGKKARVMPSPILVEQQKALGLTPVFTPFGETYNALQSGAIGAQENPISTSYVMHFYEVQNHLTLTSHGTLDQVFMVSKAWFDGLPEACQAELEAAVEGGRKVVVDETLKLDEKGLEAMKKAGVTVVEITDEQRSALREATLPVVREHFKALTGAKGDEIMKAIEAEIDKLG